VWYSGSPSDLDFKDFYPGMVALALESAEAYTKGSQYRSTYAHLHNPMIVEACFSADRRSEFLQIASGTEHEEGIPSEGTPFDMAQLLDDCFLQESDATPILTGLSAKKNIILQGPPGTGKTYIAKRLAYALMEEEAKDRVEVVQFHQSYSYEDFIQGFRPKENAGFERRDGVFFRFCDKARRDPGRDYFFLIDEINRGNLSKIFGELMMLIEADKRGDDYRVQLTYSKDGEHFSIPENVHIIGTMNTADRSLAMVDYALRRRFAFFHMPPQFNDKFEAYLQEEHSISGSMVKRIVSKLTALNTTITDDKNLGDGFEIGHSYFCTDVPKGTDEETWYAHIVDHEIGPQLLEYWFDDKAKAEAQIDKLKA
jgi:5-methylcytosine-specific restriction enzyme B